MDNSTQLSFDNDGNIIVKNRKFRRQRIKLGVSISNQPKKAKRKKRVNKRKK